MGTTIGINTMIILAGVFTLLNRLLIRKNGVCMEALRFGWYKVTLLLFLISLIGMGIQRAIWQAGLTSESFQ